jgi:hypothetical protein
MIAQKAVDAKHSQEPGSGPVAAPDLLTFTFWTSLSNHLSCPLPEACECALQLVPLLFEVRGLLRVRLSAFGYPRAQQLNLSGNSIGCRIVILILQTLAS